MVLMERGLPASGGRKSAIFRPTVRTSGSPNGFGGLLQRHRLYSECSGDGGGYGDDYFQDGFQGVFAYFHDVSCFGSSVRFRQRGRGQACAGAGVSGTCVFRAGLPVVRYAGKGREDG